MASQRKIVRSDSSEYPDYHVNNSSLLAMDLSPFPACGLVYGCFPLLLTCGRRNFTNQKRTPKESSSTNLTEWRGRSNKKLTINCSL